MLTPRKKLSKREIKEDGLLKAYAQATSFYYDNKKYISYALTGALILVIAVFVYINNQRANNEKAGAALAKVIGLFDQQQYKLAIDGQPERGVMGLKAIVENYGNSASGNVARFYLASAYYNLGQFDDALREFDDFSGDHPLMRASALAGMGGSYEAKGQFREAASYWEKASKTVESMTDKAEYLNAAARSYGRAGEKEKAVSLYKRLKKEFPTSQHARDVDRYISEFSV